MPICLKEQKDIDVALNRYVFSCLSQKEVLVVEHGDDSILVEHADSDEELNELDEEPLLLRAHPEPQALLVFTPR